MKFSINRLRSIVFLIAALGYLPLQSADTPSKKKDSVKSKIESVKVVKKTPLKATMKHLN